MLVGADLCVGPFAAGRRRGSAPTLRRGPAEEPRDFVQRPLRGGEADAPQASRVGAAERADQIGAEAIAAAAAEFA